MEDCIFCQIIEGKIPCFKVFENDDILAFLTIAPIKPGHTLVVPKKHIDYFFDLDEVLMNKLMAVSKQLAADLIKAFHPKTRKIGVMVAGLEVTHAHLHLIPMDNERELDLSLAKQVSTSELKRDFEKIKDIQIPG